MPHENTIAACRAVQSRGLYLDCSRRRIDDGGLHLLSSLADAVGLCARIDAIWQGEAINTTERRARLHTALRAPGGPRGCASLVSTATTSVRTTQ